MPESKLWLCLLTLLSMLFALVLLVEPRVAQREIDGQIAESLESSRLATESLLRLQARRWIDAAEHAAGDAVLGEALAEAPRGGANLALVHQTVVERLRQFNQDWRASLVLAVDREGRVLARTGLDEDTWSDDLSGSPLVREALHGYMLDDLWHAGDKLLRMSAAPVIVRDEYVGALLIGAEMGSELAASLRSSLGVDVAFLAAGKLVGQSASLPFIADLPSIASAHVAEIGVSRAFSVAAGRDLHTVVLASLRGEAATEGALYALVRSRPGVATPLGLLARLEMSDLRLEIVAGVAAAGTLLLLLGLLLLWREGGRPMSRLLRELQVFSRGESAAVSGRLLRGRFFQLARHINLALDTVRRTARPPAALEGGAVSDVVSLPRPPERSKATSAPQSAFTPLAIPGLPQLLAVTATVPSGKPMPVAPPPPPPRAAPDDASLAAAESVAAAGEPVTADAAAPAAAQPADPAPAIEAPRAPSSDEDFRGIFDEFIRTKRSCDENVDKVSYERFAQRLRENRRQLVERYPDREIRFEVHVKDGKAAIKAIPAPSTRP